MISGQVVDATSTNSLPPISWEKPH